MVNGQFAVPVNFYTCEKFTIHFAKQKLTIDPYASFLILSNVWKQKS